MAKSDISDFAYGVREDFNKDFMCRMLAGEFDDYEGDLRYVIRDGLTIGDIVDAYLSTGEYSNIDCPGGIEQLVEDYQNGKYD